MLAVRRQLPLGVVTFSSGNQEHGPVQFMLPPSYQEAISKQTTQPPPYYTSGKISSQLFYKVSMLDPYLIVLQSFENDNISISPVSFRR